MSLTLTFSEIRALAPDEKAVNAARKLAGPSHWQETGQCPSAVWGLCQGSALYQVCVNTATMTTRCTCPSRKVPCKHSLGLLFLVVMEPEAVPSAEPPAWVSDWLARTAARSKERADTPPGGNTERAGKRQQQRLQRITRGLNQLDLWLNDLIKNGLADLQQERGVTSLWAREAALLEDAQAPALAAQIRSLETIPGSADDWPERLLARLGRIALLSEAFYHLEQLDSGLQEDVLQALGLPLRAEQVDARGEWVSDTWQFLGQYVEEDKKLITQRTWLLGRQTGRRALLLQFCVPQAAQAFAENYPLGRQQRATLVFWPSAAPQRARLLEREGEITAIRTLPPATTCLNEALAEVAAALARQPWQERFLLLLHDVTPICLEEGLRWFLRDSHGHALPLRKGGHWQLLAISGGQAIDCAGEWDGYTLLPLGAMAPSENYQLLEIPRVRPFRF